MSAREEFEALRADVLSLKSRKRAQRDQQAAWMREKRAKDVKEGNV